MKRAKGQKGKADRLFSELVRSRSEWCERCGKGLVFADRQTAHIISRRYAKTRCVPDNAWCLCAGCHFFVDTHADEKLELVNLTIGWGRYVELKRLALSDGPKVDWEQVCVDLKALLGEVAA